MAYHPNTQALLRFFDYSHLNGQQRAISMHFHDLAEELVQELPPSAELTAGLRKLLEAKDCFVRAALDL